MDTSSDARRTAGTTAAKGGQLRSIAMIVIFDVAAPLVAYRVLRSAGMTAVTALLLSGVFPALGVTIGAVRHRRLDAVGVLVLAGIAVGTILGLVVTAPGCCWSRVRCRRPYSAWRAWARYGRGIR